MSRSNFFKKEERTTKTAPRPKLRPANLGSAPKEKAGTSGKGGGQPAEPKYDVNAKGWKDQVAKFNAKGGINNDGRFGYGYVDTQTGIEVPWYIDMINGGGANAAGDTFVSPFADAPMGGGLLGMGSQAISGGLNAMGVAPYGSNRPRYFMPMEAARVDTSGAPVQVDLGPASTGGGNGGGNGSGSNSAYNGQPSTSLFDFGAGFDRAGPVRTPAQSYRYMPMGEAGRMPVAPTGILPTSQYEPVVSSQATPYEVGNSGAGMTSGVQAVVSTPTLTTAPMTISDYLRKRGLEPTPANISKYMPDYVAAMGG